MPELPEVETIVRGLKKAIKGRQIKSIKVGVEKLFIGDSQKLVDAKIINIVRRGKNILIRLENDLTLAIHLKMTGQLIFVPQKSANSKPQALNSKQIQNYKYQIQNNNFRISNLGFKISTQSVVGGHPDKTYNQPLPHKHTHIIVEFSDWSTLYYNDLRKFGWMKVLPTKDEIKITDKLGPDPLKPIVPEYLLEIFAKRKNSPVKNVILDQQVIAGVGNIYGDESLFCAGIMPTKKAGLLTLPETKKLINCAKTVLEKSIKLGGTSRSDYRKIDGSKGNYLAVASVYGREQLPCRKCGTSIVRLKVGQRSSHYCPRCQKS